MPTFFVTAESITPPTIRITDPLLHHLRDSLRLHPGDSLTVTDPSCRRYRTEIVQVSANAIEARILDESPAPRRRTPTLILIQALLKGEKMDWVIQKSTELGVDQIVPVQTTHGVVKIQPERVDHQRGRWERIALEAAQQSERWTIPTVAPPTTLSQALQELKGTAAKFILAERSKDLALAKAMIPMEANQSIALLVGPEGGWSEEEIRQASAAGFQRVTMGERILRAETAALAAVTIVQSRMGELS